jgi:hypothetical protein
MGHNASSLIKKDVTGMAKQNAKVKELPVPDISEVSEPEEAPRQKISLDDIREALAPATDEEKAAFAEAIGLSKVIGAPKRRQKRVTDEEIKNMSLATGGASHPEDFLPIPPEHIVGLGENAVQAWQQQWLDGNVKNWDRASDAQIEEMVSSAKL